MMPRVGPVVVAEVVVRRVLAAEDGAGLGHDLLDERVADTRAHRDAAVLADDLGHGLRADEVVQDRARPGSRSSTLVGEDRGRGRARQPAPCLVDEEDAVGVAVEREPDVGARRRRPAAWRSRRFSGWIGSAGWFGNVPSSSP